MPDRGGAGRASGRLTPGRPDQRLSSRRQAAAPQRRGVLRLVHAVIEDSGYGSLDDVVRSDFQRVTGLPAVPFGLPLMAIGRLDLHLSPGSVRPVLDAARLHKPLLAIVGTGDRMVPPSEGFDIFHAAPGPKQLLVVPGAGHVAGYQVDRAQYERTVLGFLSGALGR